MVTLVRREPSDLPEAPWHETTRILGKTPLTVELDKEEHQSVVLSKDGYKPVTVQLTTTLDSWFWGNIVFGGVIGSTTDTVSGATHEYSPSQFFVTLTSTGGSTIENATLKSQREKAKEFIVLNYKNLMTDVHQGTGENLRLPGSGLAITHFPDWLMKRKWQVPFQSPAPPKLIRYR